MRPSVISSQNHTHRNNGHMLSLSPQDKDEINACTLRQILDKFFCTPYLLFDCLPPYELLGSSSALHLQVKILQGIRNMILDARAKHGAENLLPVLGILHQFFSSMKQTMLPECRQCVETILEVLLPPPNNYSCDDNDDEQIIREAASIIVTLSQRRE